MEESRKQQISALLLKKKKSTGVSDRQLAYQIGDISESVIGNIISLRWMNNEQLISDETFQRVATFLNMEEEWKINRNDINFIKVQMICDRALTKSKSYAISAPPGMCKTEASYDYANRPDVFFVQCEEHFSKKVFLQKMLQSMGMDNNGDNISDLTDRIVHTLNKKNKPLVILDEADKLNDKIFQFFITFYNKTYKSCGYVFLGSVFFEQRVRNGVSRNKQGYSEFFSRISREFIHLNDLDKKRITDICKMNGITDLEQIQEIINTSDNDLRHVKHRIELLKEKKIMARKHQIQQVA